MNGAFRTTALMGLLAAATVFGAIFYYPKTAEIVVDAKVNQNLFEAYETSDVRTISIAQFSEESNRIEQFRLRRKGERWVIPSAGDFPATQIARIGEVAKSLLDRTVLSLVTKDQQGHVEYGVIDPSEPGTNSRSSLGMRIDLLDRNRSEIANLIIGKPVPGSTDGVPRYYVRVPGQPAVYELEIPKDIFQTRFEGWVSPNLMELPVSSQDIQLQEIKINNYRIDTKKMGFGKPQPVYRFQVGAGEGNQKFEVFKDGEFTSQELSTVKWTVAQPSLVSLVNIRFVDVLGKPKAAAKVLRTPAAISDATAFKSLEPFGFRISKEDDFEAANGEVSTVTTDGVRVRMLIGSLAQRADSENLDLHFHAMLVAALEDSNFEDPTKPKDVSEDSTENKAYLRAVKELNQKRESAKQRVDELNRNWSKWIYIVPETTVNAIRPDVTL